MNKPFSHLLWANGLAQGFLDNLQGFVKSPEDCFEHGKNVPVIVMVPGFMIAPEVMAELGQKAAKHFNVAYLRGIPFRNTDILKSAEMLKSLILDLQAKWYEVIPLGWCMGGLTALEALADTKVKVDRLVTMSTPFHGTKEMERFSWLAKFRALGAKQMNHVSPERLREAERRVENILVCRTEKDRMVHPEEQDPKGVFTKYIERIFPFDHLDFLKWEHADLFVESLRAEIL